MNHGAGLGLAPAIRGRSPRVAQREPMQLGQGITPFGSVDGPLRAGRTVGLPTGSLPCHLPLPSRSARWTYHYRQFVPHTKRWMGSRQNLGGHPKPANEKAARPGTIMIAVRPRVAEARNVNR